MRFSIIAALAFGVIVEAHSIFQRLSVNGKDMGQLNGIRASLNNNPMQDVMSSDMICGRNPSSSQTIINIAAGDKIGAYWGHVIGGAQFPNDPDNPIAKSHKGPISAYLAKVGNAASAGAAGLKWFKIVEENFDTGSNTWAVDKMIVNNGWSYFNFPKCIAPGQYLLRVELLALHSAHQINGAQFYISCAQINVSGSGSFEPRSTVNIPGAYSQNDPSIFINIYGTTGQPDNGGRPYKAPGPEAITC